MKKKCEIMIVGAGFFGSTCARLLSEAGHPITLIDKRDHIGGNSWSCADPETGIECHVYGSHIFHTSDRKVWDFITRFTAFNNYHHTVYAHYRGGIFPLPVNLATVNMFFQKNFDPAEMRSFLQQECARAEEGGCNLEEHAIRQIGEDLYNAFIKGYTEKQWNRDARELPAAIIQRLPVRYNYNNRYFSDAYEGIPLDGYGALFGRILDHPGIELKLETDWFTIRDSVARGTPVIFTGPVDSFFDYRFGALEWRSIRFERQVHHLEDFQGTSVVNYTERDVPWTRIHEFRHYHPEREYERDKTVVFKEFSENYSHGMEPYYPVNTAENMEKLNRYRQESRHTPDVWFGGRLGEYKYYDMDDAILSAMNLAEQLIGRLEQSPSRRSDTEKC